MAKLVFLKRTQKEAEIFGGEVYFDINGKNVGVLQSHNYTVELPAGEYKLKMYKSHQYDTFIGCAEESIILADNEELLIKYSPPMMVNQPGKIMIVPYSPQQEALLLKTREETIQRDYIQQEIMKQQQKETYNRSGIIVLSIIVGLTIVSLLFYFLSDLMLWNML